MGLYAKIQGKRNFTSAFGLGKKKRQKKGIVSCHFVPFSVVLQGDPGPPGVPGFLVSLTFVIHLVITETEQSGMKRRRDRCVF